MNKKQILSLGGLLLALVLLTMGISRFIGGDMKDSAMLNQPTYVVKYGAHSRKPSFA